MKIDKTIKYFVEEYYVYGHGTTAEELKATRVVEGSEIAEEINDWYDQRVTLQHKDVSSGSKSAKDFIKDLVTKDYGSVCVDNFGGDYDDPTSFRFSVTKLTVYKEREIARLRDQIKDIEDLE